MVLLTGKSCTTQLILVIHSFGKHLDQGKQIDVVYLDMSKASDKVNHSTTIDKLKSYGFKGALLSWFKSQPRTTSYSVRINISPSKPLASGAHKSLFWDQSCSCFTSTIYGTQNFRLQLPSFQTTPKCPNADYVKRTVLTCWKI